MNLSLASASTVAATLLLTHACAPHRSTDAAFISRGINGIKAFFASSIPKKNKPAPIQPLDNDLVAKFKLNRRPVAAFQITAKMRVPSACSVSSELDSPFADPDGTIIPVKFDDKYSQDVYDLYKTRAIDKPQTISLEQALYELPQTLVSHVNTIAITEGNFDYQRIPLYRNVFHWWVNFACNLAFDRCNNKSIQAVIQEREVPGVAAIAMRFKMAGIRQRIDLIYQRLMSTDGITPQPMTVTNLIQYARFELVKATNKAIRVVGTVLSEPQNGIHILALFVPQRADTEAAQPYTHIQIREMFYMALSGFFQTVHQSKYIKLGKYNSKAVDFNPLEKSNSKAVAVVHLNIGDVVPFVTNLLPVLVVYIAAARAAGVNLVVWGTRRDDVWNLARTAFYESVWPTRKATIKTEALIQNIVSIGQGRL